MSTTISERPWSSYSESDYTLEQWHRACLVHMHAGPPTSKSQCKLPVRTPDGVLNRNGVHAAAAALAGARSPLKAPPDQMMKARSALRRCYAMLQEQPPDSLKQSAIEVVDDILEHFGVKGMKWGVRRAGDHFLEKGLAVSTPGSRARGAAAAKASKKVKVKDKGRKIKTSGGKGLPAHPDALRAHRVGQVVKKSGLKAVSNEDLNTFATRLQLEQNVSRLTSREKSKATQFVSNVLSQSGKSLASEAVNKGAKETGKKALKIAKSRR